MAIPDSERKMHEVPEDLGDRDSGKHLRDQLIFQAGFVGKYGGGTLSLVESVRGAIENSPRSLAVGGAAAVVMFFSKFIAERADQRIRLREVLEKNSGQPVTIYNAGVNDLDNIE